MSKRRQPLSPNSVWDADAVLAAFSAHGVKPFHAVRMWRCVTSEVRCLWRKLAGREHTQPPPPPCPSRSHLLRHPGSHWTDVPDLPKAAVQLLNEGFARFTTRCGASGVPHPQAPQRTPQHPRRPRSPSCLPAKRRRVTQCKVSGDGETTKLLVALQDGQLVESVIMHYDTRSEREPSCARPHISSPTCL